MDPNNSLGNNAVHVGDRVIAITRVFDTPREIVFDAWTIEEQLSKWWGPRGVTTITEKFEMKPGGTWQFIMRTSDGVDHPNTNVFVEVVEPERIVMNHSVFPHYLATITFEDLDGKTKLTYRTVFEEKPAIFEKIKTYAVPGAEQMMDCLEEHLASREGR